MVRKPIKIGNIELKNRIVMPPVATYQSTDDGKVTEKMLSYYGERAKGGNIGMIITEHSYIARQGKAKEKQMSISSDADIEGLGKLTGVIRQSGTKELDDLKQMNEFDRHMSVLIFMEGRWNISHYIWNRLRARSSVFWNMKSWRKRFLIFPKSSVEG